MEVLACVSLRKHSFVRQAAGLTSSKVLLVLHGVLAVFAYFNAQSKAHPLPRGVLNRTESGQKAFLAIAYLIGGVVGISNATIFMLFLRPYLPPSSRGCCASCLPGFFALLAACIIGLAFILVPLLSESIAVRAVYEHTCDGDWMTVVLTSHVFSSKDKPNRADFALTAQPNDVLFTFTSSDPDPSTLR